MKISEVLSVCFLCFFFFFFFFFLFFVLFFSVLDVKFSIYLNRRVFVIYRTD